ncbi:MAG: RluA family pseudouridine synthase [Bacilli bacterium]
MIEINITEKDSNQRVDKFVRKYLYDAPISFIYKVFRKKDVKINGHWAKIEQYIYAGDVLRIYITDEQLEEFKQPVNIEKLTFSREIIYEDNNLLVINKPKGLLVHGDEEEKRLTLANEVLSYLYKKGEFSPDDTFKPSPAHRIDRNTSGLVFFGKNMESLQCLMNLFKEKNQIEKTYTALVDGVVKESGKIDKPLYKDEVHNLVRVGVTATSKSALTYYDVKRKFSDVTLLSVRILTGRTHQIRVHMQSIDHPIIGDQKYGNFPKNKIFKEKYGLDYQFLHAGEVKFINIEGKLAYLSNKTFSAKLPEELANILNKLS